MKVTWTWKDITILYFPFLVLFAWIGAHYNDPTAKVLAISFFLGIITCIINDTNERLWRRYGGKLVEEDMMDKLVEEAIEAAVESSNYSQCGISGQKIGSSLIAENKEGNLAIFQAPNIELSTSVCIHAEQLSLLKAISEGFIKPKAVFVTSVSKDYHVPMCLLCRGWYYYANPDTDVFVVGLDKEIKLKVKLSETVLHPYNGKSRLS